MMACMLAVRLNDNEKSSKKDLGKRGYLLSYNRFYELLKSQA
jgi:hypothetical protein